MAVQKNRNDHHLTLSTILLLLLTLEVCQCHAERCAVLCDSINMQDQCERCKLRVPMRFGKRSSPPQELFALDSTMLTSSEESDSPQASRADGDDGGDASGDDLNQQFFRLLVRSMRSSGGSSTNDAAADDRGDTRRRIGRRADTDDVTAPDDVMWRKLTGNERRLGVDRQKRASPTKSGSDDAISGFAHRRSTLHSGMRRRRGWIDGSSLSKLAPSWNFPAFYSFDSPSYVPLSKTD